MLSQQFKKIIFISFVIMLLSCNKGEDPLIGNWRFVKYTSQGKITADQQKHLDCLNTSNKEQAQNINHHYHFDKDGKGEERTNLGNSPIEWSNFHKTKYQIERNSIYDNNSRETAQGEMQKNKKDLIIYSLGVESVRFDGCEGQKINIAGVLVEYYRKD